MSEFLICGLCGFRGLEIGSTVCFLCNNNGNGKQNKHAKGYIENIANLPKTDLEEEKIGLYEKYNVKIENDFPEHPTCLMESVLLGAIPREDYNNNILHENGICKHKAVSKIQAETIMMILTKYEKINNGLRSGFFLGDGTGCGKGRIIAGLIEELSCQGYNKALWLSVSQDLQYDSSRDLRDIKSNMETMNILDKKYKDTGVMFGTYNSFVKHQRYNDLVEWLGKDFQGILVFDESHKAKQCLRTKSKTAEKIIELQSTYPLARILYVSATGCSQVEHMGYMTRLNLWGKDNIHESFEEFVHETNKGGDFANEMIAMYLKKNGAYIARSLSYQKVTTSVTMIHTGEYEDIYQNAVMLVEEIRNSGLIEGKMKMMFGSCMLRFFKSFMLSFKIDKTLKMIEKCLEENMSAIVTLQSTWESHQKESYWEKIASKHAPHIILMKLLEYMKFYYDDDEQKLDKCEMLISKVENTNLGNKMNVIDSIIHKFGKENVAEITGRKKYCNENGKLVQRELTNIQEKEMFVNDQKRICVLSDAGSVGISLHDQNGKHRRFHIIMEFPWSAEQFMQQCGRSHRSGQKSAPHYQLVMTSLVGESRFLSIILKRLRTLGALTNGNRFIKTEMFELGDDYESVEGELAMHSLLHSEVLSAEVLEIFGLKCDKVSKFFNRIMMLPIKVQNDVFEKFHKRFKEYQLDDKVRQTKNEMSDIASSNIKEQVEILNKDAQLVKCDVSVVGCDFDTIMKENDDKQLYCLMKDDELFVATKLHKNSDLYKLYKPSTFKSVIHTSTSIAQYKKCKMHREEFICKWNNQVQHAKKTRQITLLTGNLYVIRKKLNNHNVFKNIQLKKITKSDNKKTFLGFHIHNNMETILKQML